MALIKGDVACQFCARPRLHVRLTAMWVLVTPNTSTRPVRTASHRIASHRSSCMTTSPPANKNILPRCACALTAVGKLWVPPALLTPRFKKLAATNQAQEERRPTPSLASVATAANGTGADHPGGRRVSAGATATEDMEWAALAEEPGDSDGLDGETGGKGEERGQEEEEEEEEDAGGRGHLMLVCRALLMCSASRTDRVRKEAALLLADANIPKAMDALQVSYYLIST